MKFIVAMLCSVFVQGMCHNCSFAQTPPSFTAVHEVEGALPANESVAIESIRWQYIDKDSNKASAEITITNSSDKKIKSVVFNVVASDKDGFVLESEGFSIRKLVAKETVEPASSKTFSFEKAFLNEKIAKLELNSAIVEYENGSIDILGSQL